MRTILTLCMSILLIGGFFIWRGMQLPTHFGEFTGAPTVAVEDLVERPKDFFGRTVAVHGAVMEQCTTMGCYFFFPSRNGKLRVELKDIAMTAPNREGRPARAEGRIVAFGDGYQLYASAVEFE
jgi:hypothetical protein